VDSHSTSIDRAIAAYGSSGGTRIELIGCGRPLSGVSLAIQGTSGQELPHGHLGEIVVRGDSVAEGYLPPSAESDDAFTATGLRTGDIGFMEDGELFVLGRAGDSVKLRGRSLFAEDVESALATLGIPMHRAAALLGWHDGEPTVLVLLERPDAGWIERVRSLLRARIEEGHMVVQPVPPGTIRRTSSGKLRRRELWRMFCEGALPVARAQDD
jgi:acyl-CoA synthetase (AMP-forming)/AMP-acid ligase II